MPNRNALVSIFGLTCAACGSEVHHHFHVLSGGAVIPAEVHGDLDESTLILVESGGPSGPGIAERAVGYHPFQDTLEPHVAVAWYDRRGTGNATGDYGADAQSMATLIDDLRAVVAVLEDRYRPARLVLLGHSFGTYTSALYQLEHPGDVEGWVAVGPSILEGPDELFIRYRRDFACRVAADQLDAGQTDVLWSEIQRFCAEHPTLPPVWDTPEREQLWTHLNAIEDRLEPWPSMDLGGLLGTVFASNYNAIDTQLRENRISSAIEAEPGREDLLPELGALQVPALVLTGEFDGTTPTELGAAVVEAMGDAASLSELPGGGHYPMADDPEWFAEQVLDWLATVPEGP